MPKVAGRFRAEIVLEADGRTRIINPAYRIKYSEYPNEGGRQKGGYQDGSMQTNLDAAWAALMSTPAGAAFRKAVKDEVKRIEGI